MTWSSALIGDDYDAHTDEPDADKAWVIKQLQQHPLLAKQGSVGAVFSTGTGKTNAGGEGELPPMISPPITDPKKEEEEKKRLLELGLQPKGASMSGWFQDTFGQDASTMVKELRMKRRLHKQYRDDIDDAITLIRSMKQSEVDSVLNSLSWAGEHTTAIRGLGLSDRDLKSLRTFGTQREVSLKQACFQWENANEAITKLSMIDGQFDESQKQLWSDAMRMKKEAKKMWGNTLHQADTLTKSNAMFLNKSVNILESYGPMNVRTLLSHMSDSDGRSKGLPTVQQMAALLKTYGVEYDVIKHKGEWEVLSRDSEILMKDPWAYAAGFLDADGYITITKRGEPRAGIVATGERGKVHCENLHKTLGCGVLQLDLKIHKNSLRSQHRLQFYSMRDLTKLLKGVSPHLRMKKNQASYVLELLALRGRDSDLISKRRDELYRLSKWENWKDVKADELLMEWNVDEAEVLSWGRQDPEVIRLIDDAVGLMEEI